MRRPGLPAHLTILALTVALFVAMPHLGVRERGEQAEHAPSDWFWAQRLNADGTWPQDRYDDALAEVQALTENAPLRTSSGSLAWQNVGPYNIGGRVTALAAAPGGSPLYLGSANGGVWTSVDGGVNWSCITERTSLVSIGAVTLDPSNPSTIWVGTGEANGSVDSYDGNGLWRSTDGGATWKSRGLASAGRISAIVVDPANPLHVLVGVMGRQFSTGPDRGLYRTLDGGASWNKVLYVSDSTGVCDVIMNPVNPDTMWCATWERVRRETYRRAYGPECGIWRSIDRGATWTRMTTGLPPADDNLGRIALAVAPSKPSTVYAQIGSGAALGYYGLGFYASTDGGTTWARRDVGTTFRNAFGGFVWYFGKTAVDPTNPNRVFALGVTLLQSTDGGVSWVNGGPSLHPDQHAIWIDPADPLHVIEGNDGGLWVMNEGIDFFQSLNLPITQFYDGEVDPTNATRIYGGTQDNNSLKTSSGPSGWFPILGGDGFFQLVDPVNPSVVFTEWQYCCDKSGFKRSTSGGPSGASTTGWVATDRFGWNTPICMNPGNHNLLLAGSNFVYRSTNNGITWAKISGDLTTNPGALVVYGCLTTLAISVADTNTYYAATDDGKVWRSTNRGGLWTDISAGLPKRWVTRVVPDPALPGGVYVTHSGYTSDLQATMIHHSTDRGTTWSNVSGNLVNVPANDLVVDPADTQRLYLATDLGVWTSSDAGGYWYPLGIGLPLQVVQDLVLHAASRKLFAFTHGRSAWSFDLLAMPASTPPATATARLALSAPWPNPSRGEVRAVLDLPRNERAEVTVFDLLGRRVATPFAGAPGAGRRTILWDGRDREGRPVNAGVYFLRASAGGAIASQRLVIAN